LPFEASAGGHTEVLKVLLEAGANPNEENKEGMTSIHLGILVLMLKDISDKSV
jgi:ankyrin repeat protein